jgi:mitochondrial fission protein ELM1
MNFTQETANSPGVGGATLWVAVTDKIGHVNQCAALTDALGVAPARLERIRGFNLSDSPRTKFRRRLLGWMQSLSLLRGVPAGRLVLIISGRSSEYAARFLRWRLGRRLFVISVGAPINRPQDIDLAVMSEAILPKWRRRRARFGDAVRLEEVVICGAMARRFGEDVPFGNVNSRLLAVLIGGDNKHFSLTGEKFRWAMARVAGIARAGDRRVEVVLSRRTSVKTEGIVRETLGGAPVTIHGREASDAYRALLARGDCFVVSPDSVTMLSEVCLFGKPVYTLDLDVFPDSDGEGERLVEGMEARGVVRRFDGEVEDILPRQRLDEAVRIAPVIAARIEGWNSLVLAEQTR